QPRHGCVVQSLQRHLLPERAHLFQQHAAGPRAAFLPAVDGDVRDPWSRQERDRSLFGGRRLLRRDRRGGAVVPEDLVREAGGVVRAPLSVLGCPLFVVCCWTLATRDWLSETYGQ